MGESSPVGIRRIHHVAFAHSDDTVVRSLGEVLGLACAAEEEGHGFVERMFRADGSFVQTLEATGPGVIDDFLARRGPALHHVAFEVADIDRAIAWLSGEGVRLVDSTARPGGGGTRVAFIHPSAFGGLLVELVEESRRKTA